MISDEGNDLKPIRPTRIGVITGLGALVIFAVTHIAFGFPEMLIHVLLLPLLIGLIVRFSTKLKHTNPWRRD